jgi:trans-AT polyketide synthase, acyltransferase and oxidoreductase domains
MTTSSQVVSLRPRARPESRDAERALALLRRVERPLHALRERGRVVLGESPTGPVVGVVPPVSPCGLGSARFRSAHRLEYAYVTGAMAGGIASVELVVAMGRAGCLGFFGAGGLSPTEIEKAAGQIQQQIGSRPYGFNLLHNEFEPEVELATVELYLRLGIDIVEAAAFMELTPAVVLYRSKGMRALPDGRVAAPHRVFAKVSRAEVAQQFLSPAPDSILRELVTLGKITEEEARLAALLPVAEDVTAEADSGGHTDQRPLAVLLPLLSAERDRAMERFDYASYGVHPRIGAAGGIGDPQSAIGALALGADYLLTGSINQACVEAGTSSVAKRLLAEASMTDTAMAPSADMFEIGARVQVLKRGTLYPHRAQKLYQLYRDHGDWDLVPAVERERVEKQILQRTFADVWAQTEAYWQSRDPAKAEDARRDAKKRMALCFRWYLGLSSRWASAGDEKRRADYQIWCGPAIGAFNDWTRDTRLQEPDQRRAAEVAHAILFGAAALARRHAAVLLGVDDLPSPARVCRPPEVEHLGVEVRSA